MHTSLKQYPGFDLPQTIRGWRRISRWRWCWCWGWWTWCCRCYGDAPPYAKEESMVSVVAISLQWLQQISPSRGGRSVPPPPSPQKIMGKIGCLFFVETKAYIRRRRWGDHRGPNKTCRRGRPGGLRHPGSFRPRGSSHLLQPLHLLLMIKYWFGWVGI
jgi:hypothetical protein